jgi:hypothetical protein
MLASSPKGHPRLFLSEDGLNGLKKLATQDDTLSALIRNLRKSADSLMAAEPTPFQIVGPRMLKSCQQILSRVATLLLVYRMTGIQRYKERAFGELRSAAAFPHWNPDHFLDTAELCAAFGIAYDWLRPSTSGEETSFIRNALIDKGLRVGLQAYSDKAWWLEHRFNWNNVCHGGLSIGALAVADEEPALADTILSMAVEKLPISLANYEPDGAWQAGPDYWEYTTWYTALFIDALQTALDDDFHLKTPGLGKTGLFPIHCTGPTGKYFNFADASVESKAKPSLFWLGRQFDRPELIHENHRLLKKQLAAGEPVDPFHFVWYIPEPFQISHLPTSTYFKGPETIFMRSAWKDPHAIFVGFKGGSNQADHGHLDIGSFVLDAFGIRWAADLGRDNYDLPGYWDGKEGGGRWKYFRLNNHSHNTLTLNDDLQRADAVAPVVRHSFSDEKSFAVMDLTAAYLPHARSVLRGIALTQEGTVIVQDEIDWAGDERKTSWNLLTDALIDCLDGKAEFLKSGKTLHASIVSPPGAEFSVATAAQAPPEEKNDGYRRLQVQIHAPPGKTVLCVVFGVRPNTKMDAVPLEEWSG